MPQSRGLLAELWEWVIGLFVRRAAASPPPPADPVPVLNVDAAIDGGVADVVEVESEPIEVEGEFMAGETTDELPDLPDAPIKRIRDKREARPDELEDVDGYQVERRAAAAYRELRAAGRAAGFAAPIFDLVSAYRGDAKQAILFEAAVKRYGSEAAARKWVAKPGGSAHRTGRTLDLNLGGSNSSKGAAALRETAAAKWLKANAARFGFAIYDPPEPWHIEHNPDGT